MFLKMEPYAKIYSYEEEQEQMENDVIGKVKDLTVWTPEEKSWWRRKPTKCKTVILDKVTGCLRRNEFAAIIGPSGAGKTTFLVSLAGKCTLPSSGTVTWYERNVKENPGLAEIVPQHEVFMPGLNVMEHLVFMIEMKLGSCKNLQNLRTLNILIEELKLKSLKHTPLTALSGGEKKLLSLATSLLSNPQILICDEPTTGLDSYNALLVISVLKKLVHNGRIVLCSIHQPSCDIFKEFNSVLLIAEGKLLFHGSHDQCAEVFESIDLHCPINYNPAEFYIRAVSGSSDNVQKLVTIFERRLQVRRSNIKEPIYCKPSQRNWFVQVHLLLWRLSLTLKRSLWELVVHLFISVFITSMVLGVSYAGAMGKTQRGIQDVRGFIWLITSEILFDMSYSALFAFEDELSLFKREVGMYKCSAYFVSRFLGFIPRCIVWPMAVVTVTTLAVDLPNHMMTSLEFLAALIINSVPAVAYGLGMAALFTSTGNMGDVMPCVDLPLFLMSGAFLRISSLPAWMYPLKYISHFYYAMDAVSNIYWRQIGHIDCPSNQTMSCVKDGISVLLENGYNTENFILQDMLGVVFVTLFWLILGYYGLRREERKGYAY